MVRRLNILQVLLLAASITVAVASRRSREGEDDGNGFNRKRTRRFGNSEAGLVASLQTLALEHEPAVIRTINEDPFLQFCDEMIPIYSKRELSSVLDEAVSNENLALIKLMEAHDKLAGVLTSDHIEELCRSPNNISIDIIEFIFDLPWFSMEELEMNPMGLMYYCVPNSFDKFKEFWAAFEAEKMLPVSNIASIVFNAAMSQNKQFIEFVVEHVADEEKRNAVMKQAFINGVRNHEPYAVEFLLQNCGVSLDILDGDLKVSALRMFTCSNCPELVRFLLSDRDVYARVRVMPDSPWIRAVNMDLPEVVEVYVQAFPFIQVRGLAMLAFSKKRRAVLEHFKSKGVLTENTLLMMALTSIKGKDLEALKIAIGLGVNLKLVDPRGFNLLSVAVEADFLDAVEYLIKQCSMDVNAVNEKLDIDNTKTFIPPIFLAKSPAMVHLLSLNGADLDAQYQKISRTGELLRSATAMHKAALDSNMAVFGALLKRGANIEIPDNTGLNNEAVLYRHLFSCPSKF